MGRTIAFVIIAPFRLIAAAGRAVYWLLLLVPRTINIIAPFRLIAAAGRAVYWLLLLVPRTIYGLGWLLLAAARVFGPQHRRQLRSTSSRRWLRGLGILLAAILVLGALQSGSYVVLGFGLLVGLAVLMHRHGGVHVRWEVPPTTTGSSSVAESSRIEPLDRPISGLGDFLMLTPRQFEAAVARILEANEHRHCRLVGGAGDRGVDLWCENGDGEPVAVQCKRNAPGKNIGSPVVQTFVGMTFVHHHANHGVFVTTARFTAEAQAVAKASGIRLIDGEKLVQLAQCVGFTSPSVPETMSPSLHSHASSASDNARAMPGATHSSNSIKYSQDGAITLRPHRVARPAPKKMPAVRSSQRNSYLHDMVPNAAATNAALVASKPKCNTAPIPMASLPEPITMRSAYCAICGTRLLEGANFCFGCGTPIRVICHRCGSAHAAGIAFCTGCGASLAARSD